MCLIMNISSQKDIKYSNFKVKHILYSTTLEQNIYNNYKISI